MKKQQSILSDSRLSKAVKTMDQFCNAVYEFPLLVKGKSGSGKTHFVTSYLNERNIPFLFLTVPDHKDYFEFVSESLARHESALKEHAEQAEQSEKQDYIKAVKDSQCPFVVIDESHQLGINPEEFQHEKKTYSFNSVEVPYSRLILISHASLGKNNSENNRLKKIVIPTPTREEIMNTLIKDGMPKNKALWSVTHSPCNFHSVIEASKDFGTELEESYNPRGLESDAIDCLSFYFHSDPAIINVYSDQFVFSKLGVNTIGNCVAKLGLDKKAILESESVLKEEGLLVTGEQSKRIIVTNDKSLKLTIAILKASNKLEFVEDDTEEEKQPNKRKPSKTLTNKEKATPKTEPKQPSKTGKRKPSKSPISKLDKIKPDKTPAQLALEIANEIKRPVNPLDD